MSTGTCSACKTDEKRRNGEPVTRHEMNQWSMWGCTCDKTNDEVADMAREFARMHD